MWLAFLVCWFVMVVGIVTIFNWLRRRDADAPYEERHPPIEPTQTTGELLLFQIKRGNSKWH